MPGSAAPRPRPDRTGDWCWRSAAVPGTQPWQWRSPRPDIDVVAVEVYRRGLAQLLSGIDREHVTNIRLIRGDGVDVLESLIAPGSPDRSAGLLPDPWPKSRHHKRRLLQPATVALIANRLRPGGLLHAATDHSGYAEQIAETGDAEPLLPACAPANRCRSR